MSNLFPELDIEVVKLSLIPKTGGDAVAYYFAEDYWPSGTIYSSNPACYPLLAGSPQVKRGVGVSAGIKYDVSIALYADSHLSEFGKTLLDLFQEYEIHNAYADVRYYAKPVAETASSTGAASGEAVRRSTPLWGGVYMAPPLPDGTIDAGDRAHIAFTYRGFWDTGGSSSPALTTHDDTVNIRQTLRVIDTSYDATNGILTLRCRDVWFKDKELAKKLDSTTFTGLDEKWKGEYGAIVFGQSTVSADGIAIDAPFFDSGIDGSDRPNAKLFSGWTFTDHPNKAFKRLLVKNQYTDQNSDTWVTVSLESDPQTAGAGETVTAPVADPPNYARDLNLYSRGIITSAATDAAKILTTVSAFIDFVPTDRCPDIIDGQHFFCNANPDFLSAEGKDFTGEMWVNADLLHTTSNRIICRQGDIASGTLEWVLYFNTVDNKLTFGVSADGTTIGTSVKWGSAASTGTWYHVTWRYNDTANEISITVNNGTAVVQTGAVVIVRRDGPFSIGSNIYGDPGFDGKVKIFRYWDRLLTTTENTTLYNSGSPLFFEELSDALIAGLRPAYDLDEPYGPREDKHGSADLVSSSNDPTTLSGSIGYTYSNGAVDFTNRNGGCECTIYEANTLDSGDVYNASSGALRTATIDLSNAQFSATLSGTTGNWQIDPPIVLAPDAEFLTAIDFTRSNGWQYIVRCRYDSNGGSTHYARDKKAKSANWAKQTDVRLYLLHYYLGQGDDAWDDGTTATEYSYQHLEAKSTVWTPSQVEFNKDLEFKICISGLADDGSGTYTGVADAVIEKPGHIIKFALMNDEFGLGLTTDDVYTSTITTAISTIETAYPDGLKMQIVIDKSMGAEELIVEICRQARMIFYKTRDGKLALHAPSVHTSVDAVFSEANDRGDLDLLAVADNDYSQVINEFHQFYEVDPVNQPTDIANIRRNPNEKLANEIFITPLESSTGDGYQTSLCTLSQELYGRREHTAPLSFYDSSTYAQPVQNYFCARYSKLQRRAKFRVPRRDYFEALDIFSALRVIHTGIPDAEGTTLKGKAHDTGTPYPAYDEGVPVLIWAGGTLEGHVVEVEEEGQWMAFTIETISLFK